MEGSWLSHPFWKTKFVLTDAEDLKALKASGVPFCWIDASKGLDVAPPAAARSAAPAARAASATRRDKPVIQGSLRSMTSATSSSGVCSAASAPFRSGALPGARQPGSPWAPRSGPAIELAIAASPTASWAPSSSAAIQSAACRVDSATSACGYLASACSAMCRSAAGSPWTRLKISRSPASATAKTTAGTASPRRPAGLPRPSQVSKRWCIARSMPTGRPSSRA
ncbi:DUF3391 domain-containing protein, partial [Mitsuaria sp. TWR114]|uniref:DUF3391 domain-containing protein n=1 Tax=Mitsuaria sp. TWR114 TaxID=2601731 RepID=UPI003857AA9C